jgi:UDP-N-acetylglucosamine--N-acetylmuramyl-(pentapeptide) pyrophosphoryl-undecaprenol N-acetylglucosamine transferase
MSGPVLLCAGGTGGHLFPAQALAHELRGRGLSVHLATDERAERFAGEFPADETHVIESATITSKNPIALARTGLKLFQGLRQSGRLLARIKPRVVVGFGGYPTLPPVMAASRAGIPSIIQEQNAVMGRANRFLAGPHDEKIVITGNPVRPDVLAASKTAYRAAGADKPFHLLVFGGSQGAHFFSEIMPEALVLLSEELRKRLRIVHQARPEDMDAVKSFYEDNIIRAEVSPFFTDMANRIAQAHLVISRSGASTVSELSVIGRPAILVPFPYALDHDQAANAAALEAQGGARLIRQEDLGAVTLSEMIKDYMENPDSLVSMAQNAKNAGEPNATRLLGDLVVDIADGSSPTGERSAQP